MLSLLVNKLESVNNSKVEIYLAISAIVYVILHYLIFNKLNNYTSKYKYIFYLFVIMDIIYAHKLYKSKLIKPLKTETKEPEDKNEVNYPQMIIERPFIDNDVHNQQYTPFVGNINLIPQNQIEQMIKNEGRNITIQQNKEQIKNDEIEIKDDNKEINNKNNIRDNKENKDDNKSETKDNIINNASDGVSDVKESNNEVNNDTKEEKEDNKDADNKDNDKDIEDEEITLSPVKMD